MSNVWGTRLKISLFGESHGEAIGIIIDGLPVGLSFDFDEIESEMARRAPGKDRFSTQRQEEDAVQILSGYFNNKTCGTPLCAMIKNSNTKSSDYDELKTKMRPSHADYPAFVKYKGFNDYRGGGHFSGRITAPIVLAGAICKQLLRSKNIFTGSHIFSIKDIKDDAFDPVSIEQDLLDSLRLSNFPVLNQDMGKKMQQEIINAKESKDSVGGIIESAICGVSAGLGNPFFESIESKISSFIFSIPGVKGIEFGDGFDIAKLNGSMANDTLFIKDGVVKTKTNHSGGINGGISNGMPIILKTAMRPTASIALEQNTVDILAFENIKLSVRGRHDPCIVKRALPVIDSALCIVMTDLLLEAGETFG